MLLFIFLSPPPTKKRAEFSATASLGVVHARHITEAISILQPYLPPTPNDIDPNIELKEVLYTDSAVAGEAAGLAIGLVLVGSGADNIVVGNTTNSL